MAALSVDEVVKTRKVVFMAEEKDEEESSFKKWYKKYKGRLAVILVICVLLASSIQERMDATNARDNFKKVTNARIGEDERAAELRTKLGCTSRQNLYDGQIQFADFISREAHLTEVQTANLLRDLKKELGVRPVCPP